MSIHTIVAIPNTQKRVVVGRRFPLRSFAEYTGKVTHNGVAVTGASVTFYPYSTVVIIPASFLTDENIPSTLLVHEKRGASGEEEVLATLYVDGEEDEETPAVRSVVYDVADYDSVGAAMSQAVEEGGGIVYFSPRSTPYLSAYFDVPNNIVLRGGPGAVLKRTGASSSVFINFTGSTRNSGIENLAIDSAGIGANIVRFSTGARKCWVKCADFTSSNGEVTNVIDIQTGTYDITVEQNDAYNSPMPVGDGNVTFTDSGDLAQTPYAHGLAVGNVVTFATTTTNVVAGAYYFVLSTPSATTFTISEGFGGTQFAITSDGTATGLAKANALTNIVKATGKVTNLSVVRNKFKGFKERAIWLLGTTDAGTRNTDLTDNLISDMIPGGIARQPIAVQGAGEKYHYNLNVLDNRVYGMNTGYHDGTLRGSADLISIHRAIGFLVSRNYAWYGGDVGITIAQQCKDGVVSENNCQFNDTWGMTLGSNTSAYVSDITVTTNIVKNNGQNRGPTVRPAHARTGFQFSEAHNCHASANIIGDDQTVKTQTFAFHFIDTDNVQVGVNQLLGHVTGDYNIDTGNTNLDFGDTGGAAVEEKIFTAVKSANQTKTGDPAATADADLVIPNVAPGKYIVEAYLVYNSGTVPDLRFGWTYPAGTTIQWSTGGLTVGAASATVATSSALYVASDTPAIGGVGADVVATPRGSLTVTTTGNVGIRWGQFTSDAGNTTLYAGSWLRLTKIA